MYRCLRVPFNIGLFDRLIGPDITILAPFDVVSRAFVSAVAA